MAENRPAPPPACTSSRPPGRNFGSVDVRARLGHALGDAAGAAHDLAARELQRLVELASSTRSRSSRPRRTPARARGRRRGWRRSRAAASGGARVRRQAASDARERLGVARHLVDDAPRALAGEQRDGRRRRARSRARRASGSHGEPSSSSAKQNESLPGLPCAARSTPPGRPPPTLRMTSCSARPMVEVGPVALAEHVHAAVHPDAPGGSARCTIITGPTGIVVASTPWMLNSSVQVASTRGEHQRQVLGLAAGHHRVDRDLLDRALDEVGRHDGDDVVGRAGRALEHPQHARLGRRHDRQAVGPAAVEQRLQLVLERRRARRGGSAARDPRTARAARRPGRGRPTAIRSPDACTGRSAPRSVTPVSACHEGREPSRRCGRPRRRPRRGSASARSRCRGATRRRGRRRGSASTPAGNVGSSCVYTVRAAPDSRSWRSTGATSTQVAHSSLTTTTMPSGSDTFGRYPRCET